MLVTMPFNIRSEMSSRVMEEYVSELSVIDVYDIASDIGKEFEKMIDDCGSDAVSNLMPKVINALEHLESLATKNERENITLDDLRSRVVKLENDKHLKQEDRVRFEKELEQIEEDWRKESNQLLKVVSHLQEENRRLNSILSEKSYGVASSPEVDVNVMYQLQNQVDQLREKIKLQNSELNTKSSEIDNLENQIEHLNCTLKDMRRKQKTSQSQLHALIEERAESLMQIQDRQRDVILLRQRLGTVQRENEDLAKSNEEIPDLKNKVIYDIDDPNRPRFTVQELKEILYERNELKAKVNDLEDELSSYKITPEVDSPEETTLESAEEEPAVQGPLPLEPDDAPWKKSESGVRKLFKKLFGDQNLSPSRIKFYK